MFGFRYPLVLVALVIPVALLVWVWVRADRRIVLPFDFGRQGNGSWLRAALGVAESLPAAVLAVAILVLAQPEQLGEPRDKRKLTNIEFCVDVSGSMSTKFGDGTRYDASLEAINDFLDFRKGDAFGLTFFGNNVLQWVPLTSDSSAVRCAPPFMRPEVVPLWLGGTEIGKALLACREVLVKREDGDRMIILVSDGDSFDLFNGRDMEIAARLKADNIAVFAVHISDSAIPDQIANITSLTGGEVFSPNDAEALKGVFRRIDEMKQTELEKTAAEKMDHFFPYCLAALSLLGTGMLALFGVRYTPW